jgi:hypothetical protein
VVVLGEVQEMVVHVELSQLWLAESIRVRCAKCSGQETHNLQQSRQGEQQASKDHLIGLGTKCLCGMCQCHKI